MPVSTLTAKYQATIPRQVREALQVSAGDRIEFLIDARYGVGTTQNVSTCRPATRTVAR